MEDAQRCVTIKDGIMLRCDDKNMLRKPRSSLLLEKSTYRDNGNINKVRLGLVMKKQKATQLIQALTQAVKEKSTDTAADLCLTASKDTTNEFNEIKQDLLKQYYTFHGRYLDKMDVPRIPDKPPQSVNPRVVLSDTSTTHSGAPSHRKVTRNLTSSQEYYKTPIPRQALTRPVRAVTALPATRTREYGSEHYSRERSQSSTIHATQITDMNSGELLSKGEDIKRRVKSASYCQTPRHQYEAQTDQQQDENEDKREENSRTVVKINSSPLLRGRIKYRSPWLSPLQMSNVPADAKLRYINNAEKHRFKEVMSYTSKLLNSKYVNAATTGGQPLRKHLSYRPKLEHNNKTVTIKDHSTEQKPLTTADKIDLLATQVHEHRAHSAVTRLQNSNPPRCCSPERLISSSIDPLRLGSVTSKALITSFCLLTQSS